MNIFFILLINMLYGIGFIITKIALTAGSPLFLIAFRMLIAGALILGYQWFFNRKNFTLPRPFIIPLVAFGILYMYLANAFEFWSLKTLSPTNVAFLYNLSPFIAAFIATLYKRIKLSLLQLIGIVISFIGSSFLIIIDSRTSCLSLLSLSCGELLLLCAIFATIFGSFILQGLIKDEHYSSGMINGIGMTVGGLCALVHSGLTEQWNPVPVISTSSFLFWAFVMIILYNIIAYELYNRLSRYYTVTFLTLSWLTTPFFTAFFERILFGTPITGYFWIAYGIVFCGFLCFYSHELRTMRIK